MGDGERKECRGSEEESIQNRHQFNDSGFAVPNRYWRLSDYEVEKIERMEVDLVSSIFEITNQNRTPHNLYNNIQYAKLHPL